MAENISRPNPDELLARVKAEQARATRGKLKIFVGYAPGVGKTFTMLEAAHLRKKDTDVVAAVVETHGRTETEALLKDLEVIPRFQKEYRGITLSEMDLNAVLKRHPQLALVDEFAHTNVPGLRHEKRYQDVEELLDAGIDVYTTLNIQHVESVRDVVAQITGVWIHETVPDSVIDNASEIELVDLPPEELLKRLKEGKIYVPQQIQQAITKFFQKGNLLALRELTMRTAAKHTDEQTQDYMREHDIHGPWSSGERLVLFIGPDSSGSRQVRTARRLAHELGAEWSAVYIETPDSARLSPDQQDQITESLRLAERLGAKPVTLQGNSVAGTLLEYAKANNITKIVISRPKRTVWQRITGRSVVSQIMNESEIDVYITRGGGETVKREVPSAPATPINWRGYMRGMGLVVLATLLGELAPGFLAPANLIMVYLLCVGVTAFLWGYGPSILVSIFSVLLFDFLFIPPVLTFKVSDTKYILTFVVLLLVGLSISYLMDRIRQQTEAAKRRERLMEALYALGRDLAVANDMDSYIRTVIKRSNETFGRQTLVFLPGSKNEDALKPYTETPDIVVNENESAAAIWAFQHQKIVGYGTDTLPNAEYRYVPMVTPRATIGVIALSKADKQLTIEQERLLEAYSDLSAIAIESMILNQEAQNLKTSRDTEKLQTALLNAVSHDLRTPLVSVIGVLSSLQEEGMNLDDSAKSNLIQVAREQADRLNRLITNLLDVSRVESGALRISKQFSDVQDLVGAALEQMGPRTAGRPINIEVPVGLPFVSVDFGLIVQTLVNILDNAFKYSASGSPVDINAKQVGREVYIEIADRGIGIPAQDLVRVFDKFYRIQNPDNVTGTGLGLSICKGIIEAHGGRIAAENRPEGGTVIRIILPAAESKQPSKGTPHA